MPVFRHLPIYIVLELRQTFNTFKQVIKQMVVAQMKLDYLSVLITIDVYTIQPYVETLSNCIHINNR